MARGAWHRSWPAAGLLLAAALAGCSGSQACPATNAHVTADSGGTQDIQVHLEDGTSAVLHLAHAAIYRASGDRCLPETSSAIYIGAKLDIHVDAWAGSYPQQGTPDAVVLR